jgi:hypothetical protein
MKIMDEYSALAKHLTCRQHVNDDFFAFWHRMEEFNPPAANNIKIVCGILLKINNFIFFIKSALRGQFKTGDFFVGQIGKKLDIIEIARSLAWIFENLLVCNLGHDLADVKGSHLIDGAL